MPRRSLTDMGFADSAVNLATIAEKLGVSISTVSRALRNVRGTHPLTRSRVLDLAASLGYQASAKEDAAPTVRTVLSLSQGQGGVGDEMYLAGMSRASVVLNLSLVSHHYGPSDCDKVLNSRFQPPALRTGAIDGIVLMHRWPDEVVTQLARQYPVVSIVHGYPLLGIDLIGVDDREGVLTMVRHLASRGHRRIGFFGFCGAMSWARSRYCAFLEAMTERDHAIDPRDIISVSLEEALAEGESDMAGPTSQAAERVKEGVTAWVGASDILAYGLCRALIDRGLRVPKDVAVTGYHASKSTPFGLARLTSTQVASDELGAAALRRLVTRIDNPEESRRSILLPTEFVQGETT